MAIDLKKTQEKLDKLRRNETQMTPEQKIAWKKNLQAYRNQIIAEANEILREFVFGQMNVLKEDEGAVDQIISRIEKMAKTDWWKKQMENAKDVLFRTYSLTRGWIISFTFLRSSSLPCAKITFAIRSLSISPSSARTSLPRRSTSSL